MVCSILYTPYEANNYYYGDKMTDKQWTTMLAMHNTAPFKLVRAAAPYFRLRDGEARIIINISSTSGVHGNAYVSLSTYYFTSKG